MKFSSKIILLIISVSLIIFIYGCYTQTNDQALYNYVPGEIYGCWVSKGNWDGTSTHNVDQSNYFKPPALNYSWNRY